jgi:UDP-N-acetylglucosamine diphosphorylase / glucose-1-phosphate thymidylyltransferase / UDP-N-acetylgalactosamine diphosphorylase / glucosamine-1-phosphate N-acetyltransferase / galactosamine-1-phosphate N-acetyltransferase
MICIDDYTNSFSTYFQQENKQPWEIINVLPDIINHLITQLSNDFIIVNGAAIHKTATIEAGVVLKPPVIVGANCFIGANAYLRGGVFLGGGVKLDPVAKLNPALFVMQLHWHILILLATALLAVT